MRSQAGPHVIDDRLGAPPRLRAADSRRHPHPVPSERRIVLRPRLVEPLLDASNRLVLLVAPAGYGKSTVLRAWRRLDPRPFAWASLSADDDDPCRLLRTISSALSLVGPITEPTPALDERGTALSLLGPFVLVLDDAGELRSAGSHAVVARLVSQMPAGSTVALAGRRRPALPIGRLRAEDGVVEVGADHLAMTRTETAEVLARAGVTLTEQETDRLYALTRGWPAALRLAVRAVREQRDASAAARTFAGDDGIVGDYVREELLAGLSRRERDFLRRTSVIDRLDGAACDAALGRTDSARMLTTLVRADAPLIPLDRSEREFGHHPLVAQALRAELSRTEPGLAERMHVRLASFYELQGDRRRAAAHAVASGDADRSGALLAESAVGLVAGGDAALVDGWLCALGDSAVARRPSLALAAALSRLAAGEREQAEGWAKIAAGRAAESADRAPEAILREAAVIRAWCARGSVELMTVAAQRARASMPPHGAWRALACLVEGSGLSLAGRTTEALARLEEGAGCAVFDAPLLRSLCLAHAAWLHAQRGVVDDAAILSRKACDAIPSEPAAASPLTALTHAVSAYVHASRGEVDAARRALDRAARRLSELHDPPPWFGALVRAVQARASLRLSDAREGRRLLSDASRLRRAVDDAEALQTWIDEAWGLADDFAAGPVACPTTLTVAELRVLRLLPSHLTFREIAVRLHVSANTVKTQAHAVYRKLDARSRSQAVEHATAIGLVDW